MENFLRSNCIGFRYLTQVVVVAKIRVPVAVSVGHLRNHDTQNAARIMA